jgi:hypothetical protein
VFAILLTPTAIAVATQIDLLVEYSGQRFAEAGAWVAGVLFGVNVAAFTILYLTSPYLKLTSPYLTRRAAMPWANGDLTVYHGTDTRTLAGHGSLTPGSTLNFIANLSYCRPATDFGQGFYTTTSLHQAREWANARVRRLPTPPQPQPQGIVLQFDLERDWLAKQQSLVFVRAIPDYWDFVTHCRVGLAVHGRGSPNAKYDVVYGLVTIWPSRLLIQDCDQISFHTTAAVGNLKQPTVADVANTADGLFA